MLIEIQLDGIDAALRKLKKYLNPERDKIMRKAYDAAGKYIRDTAKRLVKQQSGTLRKSLILKVKYYRQKGIIVAIIGPKTNYQGSYKGVTRVAHKYGHLVEGGRKSFQQEFRPFLRMGNDVKIMRVVPAAKPKPFIGKAVRQGQRRALDIISNTIKKGLEK
jgi:HK97 gp10 family phage protein